MGDMTQKVRRSKARYDKLQWTPDAPTLHAYNSVALARQGLQPFGKETVRQWAAEARHNQGPSWLLPRWPNGRNDPASIALVLDCLLRLTPGPGITSAMLVGFLDEDYDQIRWDPVTVGRILHSLTEAAHDKIAHTDYEGGDPAHPVTRTQNGPIWVYKTSGMNQFVIEDNLPARRWLGAARSLAARSAKVRRDLETTWPEETVWGPFFDLPYGTGPDTYWNDLLHAGSEVGHLQR